MIVVQIVRFLFVVEKAISYPTGELMFADLKN